MTIDVQDAGDVQIDTRSTQKCTWVQISSHLSGFSTLEAVGCGSMGQLESLR